MSSMNEIKMNKPGLDLPGKTPKIEFKHNFNTNTQQYKISEDKSYLSYKQV
jgi:hypothetical protein